MGEFILWLRKYKPEMMDGDELNRNTFTADSLMLFCSAKRKWDKKREINVTLSFSGLNRYKSALKWYIKKQGWALSPEDNEGLREFFKGLKKRCARERQSGVRDMREGKMQLPYPIYVELAKYWWSKGSFFEVAYLVLTWNLGCRTNNTEGIRLKHLSWVGDALQIEFGVTKTNQEGLRDECRLLFANPTEPSICPILALGTYLLSISTSLNETSPLFFGSSQAQRFHESLATTMKTVYFRNALSLFGLVPSDIGAHSIRKGAGTFLTSGSTAGPSMPSVCIRMSWKFGNTQERYLGYTPASDAYCGRILCGLDQNSIKFATLPPHLLVPATLSTTKVTFPSTSSVISLERVRQFCFASLLCHLSFLKDIVPENNKIFHTPFFMNSSHYITSHTILVGHSSPILSASGLPPHVLSWLHDSEVKAMVAALPEKILGGVGEVLKREGVASGNITKELMQEMISNLLQEAVGERNHVTDLPILPTFDFEAYLWSDGAFHLLQEDYRFPDVSVKQCWILWWKGNLAKKTPPYYKLTQHDVPKVERKRYSDVKCCMKKLISVLVLESDGFEEKTCITSTQLELLDLVDKGLKYVDKKAKTTKKSSRWEEWMVTTALREMREAMTEENPEKKRKQKAPKQVPKNKDKRTLK
jgi:hypothetical protein